MLKKKDGLNIAVYIDGPNLLRKEFTIDLAKLREKIKKHGRVVEAKVFLNQFVSEKLIEALSNEGFEPIVTMGGLKNEEKSDVDANMAAAVMEGAFNDNIDIVAIGTRDADFAPVVNRVKARGKRVVVIGINPGFSKALQNAADDVELI